MSDVSATVSHVNVCHHVTPVSVGRVLDNIQDPLPRLAPEKRPSRRRQRDRFHSIIGASSARGQCIMTTASQSIEDLTERCSDLKAENDSLRDVNESLVAELSRIERDVNREVDLRIRAIRVAHQLIQPVLLVTSKDIERAFEVDKSTVSKWVKESWFPRKQPDGPACWLADEVTRAVQLNRTHKQCKTWRDVGATIR